MKDINFLPSRQAYRRRLRDQGQLHPRKMEGRIYLLGKQSVTSPPAQAMEGGSSLLNSNRIDHIYEDLR
jgi:hypothetical protein